MALTTLKDDLLHEFREERVLINEQLEMLDPLATSLRKPAAQRLLSSGTLIISEVGCYILCLGGLAFTALMHRIYPFSVLSDIYFDGPSRVKAGSENMLYLALAVYGLSLMGVALMFIIARLAREMRLKNDILNLAGKDIKTLMGQHLERKAALDTIEQRHMLGLSGVSQQPPKETIVENSSTVFRSTGLGSVNHIPNPGF